MQALDTSLVVAAIAGIVWLVRLEGRVNTTEQLSQQRFGDLKEDVEYIRDRIDEFMQKGQ